jgi:hypothetical protein
MDAPKTASAPTMKSPNDLPRVEAMILQRHTMDQETHGHSMGQIVQGCDQLKAAIDEALSHPGRLAPQRRRTAEHIFHNPGGATRRVANRLRELAGTDLRGN